MRGFLYSPINAISFECHKSVYNAKGTYTTKLAFHVQRTNKRGVCQSHCCVMPTWHLQALCLSPGTRSSIINLTSASGMYNFIVEVV